MNGQVLLVVGGVVGVETAHGWTLVLHTAGQVKGLAPVPLVMRERFHVRLEEVRRGRPAVGGLGRGGAWGLSQTVRAVERVSGEAGGQGIGQRQVLRFLQHVDLPL